VTAVVTIKIAFRSLLRRPGRMVMIGLLVVFGTFLLVFGETFTRSAKAASEASIINNFTGDFIVYAARSKETPSPFAFNTPLPNIQDIDGITGYLGGLPEVEAVVPFAQNYSVISVEGPKGRIEMPFIFYAIPPASYGRAFANARMLKGDYFSSGDGILISAWQNAQYLKRYNVQLSVGDAVTVLGLSDGGGVNAVPTRVRGIFDPIYYKNVFNYINFIDINTYSRLYNFTGVAKGSLPAGLEKGLAAASKGEDDIFALAGDSASTKIDTSKLTSESLSGFTMIAVKLKDHAALGPVMARVAARGLGVKLARWDEASGFFARISSALQGFIYFATALIFLVVSFIFTNTLIINIIERTGEIGTMRALGSEKGFIRGIFLSETLMLNGAACLVGLLLSALVILGFSRTGIPLPDTVSQYIIGGGNLPLSLGAVPFVLAPAVVVVVSVLATLYPVRVATSITPLAAMNDR
jgi:ABC-type lipoprotein release transport system permease subunit